MRTAKQATADRRRLWRDINREHRKAARAKLTSLRGVLRDTRVRRKKALLDAKERCRSERLAAREKARAIRLRVIEELREAVRAERAAARQACSVRLVEARAIKDEIARARAEYHAEQKYQRDLRAIERANRQRRKEAPKVTRLEREGESDDEVRGEIPADMVPLFEKVKRQIKATPRMSRTEAFFKYAEEHPDEVLVALDDKTDAMIRDLERQEREAARELRRGTRRGTSMPEPSNVSDEPGPVDENEVGWNEWASLLGPAGPQPSSAVRAAPVSSATDRYRQPGRDERGTHVDAKASSVAAWRASAMANATGSAEHHRAAAKAHREASRLTQGGETHHASADHTAASLRHSDIADGRPLPFDVYGRERGGEKPSYVSNWERSSHAER